jgi:hypothetical protein
VNRLFGKIGFGSTSESGSDQKGPDPASQHCLKKSVAFWLHGKKQDIIFLIFLENAELGDRFKVSKDDFPAVFIFVKDNLKGNTYR